LNVKSRNPESILRRAPAVPGAALICVAATAAKDIKLLNVFFDPARGLYQDFNAAFAKRWKEKTRDTLWPSREASQRVGKHVSADAPGRSEPAANS
jgi:ABC-type sulfate transport system substrate-binding protein